MEDYRVLYKKSRAGRSRDEKRETALREQKKKREDTFYGRRNIIEDQEASSSARTSPAPGKKGKETRREKLMKWKVEKEKLQAQQKLHEKKKPPFKVGVAHYSIDPKAELVAIHATTVKCTTSKKAAAELRVNAAEKRKAKSPTSAASSLAALCAPAASSTFSGRVTRSRTAAAATGSSGTASSRLELSQAKVGVRSKQAVTAKPGPSKVPPIKQAVAAKPGPPKVVSKASADLKVKRSQPTAVAGSSKVSRVPSTRSAAVTDAAVKASQSKARSKDVETSFAPKNHKFKAPANLTLPTTPLTLKRKAVALKDGIWPHIPGVNFLSDSPSEPSPKSAKVTKQVAAARRGRLSRAAKEPTPLKKSGKRKSYNAEQPSTEMSPSLKKTSSGGRSLGSAKQLTPRKTPKSSKSTIAKETQMSSSLKSTPSGVFVVTEKSESKTPKLRKTSNSRNVDETYEDLVDASNSGSSSYPTQPMSNKKRRSTRGKENTPSKIETKSDFAECLSMSFQEDAAMESVISDSRRMSIHEPSPPVHVSPENLSMGMVPAQFSPYITSARGKDKYSLQKRRSSLVPVVPDIPPEELARSNQVEHFRNLLERESSRLLTLSASWEERKNDAPPHVQDMILGSIGQARLLVNDKFQQFRRLVDNFEMDHQDVKMTTDDLTGFWEMMLLTVENVDKRFKELEDMKGNNWEEIMQESEVAVKKTVSAAPAISKLSKPRTLAQSRLKDIIEAARKRKYELKQKLSRNTSTASNDTTSFDGGFFQIDSPKKVLSSPRVATKSPAPRSPTLKGVTPRQFQRRSLLQQVLRNSAVRARCSSASSPLNKSLPVSPSPKVVVAQMRASELGKRMSADFSNESFSFESSSPGSRAEPSRSILKSGARKITVPRNRVAFEISRSSTNSSPGSPYSPSLQSPATPPIRTPLQARIVTPGSRRRASLIPRLIPTPKGERLSLLPVRESLIPSKPLPGGDLIEFSSPTRGSLV